jgi:23S rRNA (adenine2503-C2)-methyltransferase
MIPLSALFPDELAAALQLLPPYRGRQIFSWIHDRLVFDFTAMSDLPAAVRQRLSEIAKPVSLEQDAVLADVGGVVKYRFLLQDDRAVESVVLRDRKKRATACLSTQVGCAMGCSFCRTGSLGFSRDLEAHEIVDQFLLLRSLEAPDLSNVVFMGMGEPLANLDNLQRAVEILSSSGFSPRRITVSTCGLVEGIRSLGERNLGLRLAVSLNSADAQVRDHIMPINRSNPLPELRRALQDYQAASGKRITLEIVLMAGINDRSADVESLVRFVKGREGQSALKVLINLIPWNPLPDFPYQRPEAGRIVWFKQRIEQAGIPVTTRLSRGGAVSGACGQLGLAT